MREHTETGPEEPITTTDDTVTPGQRTRKSRGALVIPLVLLALGVFLVVGTTTMDEVGDGGLFGARTFPWIVAVLCFAMAAAMTVDILRPALPGAPTETQDDINWAAVGTSVGGVVVFIVSLQWLGWILSATLLFTIVAVGLGNRRYLTCVLVGLAVASIIQLVFSGFLGVSLPAGIVGGV